jgi:hypothetical protein
MGVAKTLKYKQKLIIRFCEIADRPRCSWRKLCARNANFKHLDDGFDACLKSNLAHIVAAGAAAARAGNVDIFCISRSLDCFCLPKGIQNKMEEEVVLGATQKV